MAYESYRLSLPFSTGVKDRMLNEKARHIRFLFDQAVDREENTLLNGIPFTESPRIFDRKFIDNIHHKITVETILKEDRMECGDYLEYDGMMWLCLNSFVFHELYCRATFTSCDWKIYWIDENGQLQSQYVVDQNSTQYNSGETGNSTMTLGSSQHMLKMQCNENTILIDSPMRFAIDKNQKRPTCYKVTQNDNTAYNYGKGLCCITVSEAAFNHITDKRIKLEDASQIWVCDYAERTSAPIMPNETVGLSAVILGNTKLRSSSKRTYSVVFADKNGDAVDWSKVDYQWDLAADFHIEYAICDNEITLFINNDDLIGSNFLLRVMIDDTPIAQSKINIVE